jgi:tryptophan synthase alpha chain
MTRLKKFFAKKSSGILNVYCTAGYPELNDTLIVMKALQDNGADIIELGMPFSDPLADGPVIQSSSAVAIANGMSIPVLFEQLKELRKDISVPVVLMGYLNPVLKYGFENFCSKCAEVGIDGLIVPDIPVYEYERDYQQIVKKHGLDFIFLVTPETSEERIRTFDRLSSGFLYAVSSSGITGKKKATDITNYLQRLKDMNLQNPLLVGFGISDKKSFDAACKLATGAIIGSAFIQALRKGEIEASTHEFLSGIR